ncbi:hypothetical protein EFK50_04745 [Nocardioides marmoriginsengisoli]|uniref:Galactose oxidase n=1 Tax=Nocardioides marmoriginsengisoli TaxID=661483 RepID=A0A3N0CP79_9ACTN|nr:hypothetical protein [Nocardioides marmoriginsengisoli]RNL65272.1 hypothetical protein EFK50_04745 [Nocardioides marmoriginsengisoli]
MPRILGLALLAALTLTGCGAEAQPDPNDRAPGWQRLTEAPLSPRSAPVVVWTGSEVLAIGGEVGDTCPPNADCAFPNESAADGAALDPDVGTWRPIAPAPVPVPGYSPSAVVDGHLFVRVGRKLLDYDLDADRWRVLTRPSSDWYDLEADGDRLLLVSGSDENGVRPDLAYEPVTRAWSELPEDPLGPLFDRGLLATPAGVLLVGKELVASPGGGDRPSYVLGALLDRSTGTWSTLPRSDQLGGGSWGVIGSRVVNLSLDSSNGGGPGAGDYGRRIPFGGTLDLGTKTWGRLPNPPKYLTGGWPVGAVGTDRIAAEGWIYDGTASWTKVPHPRGAAVQPGPAVWAGDRLIVIGGTHQTSDNKTNRDGSVWAWRPEPGPRQ